MSTIPPNNPKAEQLDEELVAYLDGELEPQAAGRLEELLARDEPARRRLNQLANSWELLDQLPRATVDDLFTRTTVEMVALAAEDEIAKKQTGQPSQRWLRWFGGAVVVLCGAVVGFVVMALTLPDQNEPLLKDLRIVQNLELYESVMSLDFIKQLQTANLFVKDAAAAASGNPSAQTEHTPSTSPARQSAANLTSMDARRAWVAALSAADKAELRSNFERFMDFPPKEQQALHELDQALSHEGAAEEAKYRRIIDRYYEWWKTLDPISRYNLSAENDLQKRVALVKQLRSDQVAHMSGGLKDPDSDAIFHWARKFSQDHRAELPVTDEQRADMLGRRRQPWILAYESWWSTSPTVKFPPVTDADLQALRDRLSPEKQAQFAAQPGLYERVVLVRGWIQNVQHELQDLVDQGFTPWTYFGPTRQRLDRFFSQELTPSERQDLQSLSEGERNRKLRELFFQRHRPPESQRTTGPVARPGTESPPQHNTTDAKKTDNSHPAQPVDK